VKIPAKPSLFPWPAGISDGGLAPLVLGALGANGSLHVHNVAAARQRLDPEEANIVDCSAPRTGDGEPSSRGARGDNRSVHHWSRLPVARPNYLRRAQTRPIHASLERRLVSSCNTRADLGDRHTPMSRRRSSGPRWRRGPAAAPARGETRGWGRFSGFTPSGRFRRVGSDQTHT
jgi:hypothetical protein